MRRCNTETWEVKERQGILNHDYPAQFDILGKEMNIPSRCGKWHLEYKSAKNKQGIHSNSFANALVNWSEGEPGGTNKQRSARPIFYLLLPSGRYSPAGLLQRRSKRMKKLGTMPRDLMAHEVFTDRTS